MMMMMMEEVTFPGSAAQAAVKRVVSAEKQNPGTVAMERVVSAGMIQLTVMSHLTVLH